MKEKVAVLKATARLAGLFYFILGVFAYYALMYIPKKIMVRGDTALSADNLLAHEFLYRTGIASHLISVITFLFLALSLYKLFKQTNAEKAKLLVALVVVQVPIVFLLETLNMTCLMILKGQVLRSLPIEQSKDLAMLFLKIHGYGINILEVFWGLWLIPFGQLVYKSVFIPRVLGVLLIIAGIGYAIDSLTFLLLPEYRSITQTVAFILAGLGEGSIILWLLIVGVRDHLSITVISETESRRNPGIQKITEYI